MASLYIRTLSYADDLVLLAPSAAAVRRILDICDNFARDFHVLFSAMMPSSLNALFFLLFMATVVFPHPYGPYPVFILVIKSLKT
jgi:hypothetical protein